MKLNQADMSKSASDYADAFNEDEPKKAEPTEDQAFGLDDGKGAEPAAVIAVVDDSAKGGEPGGQTDMEAKGDAGEAVQSGNDTVPRNDGEDGGVPTDLAKPGDAAVKAHEPVEVQAKSMGANGAPMSEQQLRSWEGRLKKAQADLDAAGKAGKGAPANGTGDEDGDTPKGAPNAPEIDALEKVEETAKNPELAKAAGDMADKVEAGQVSADDAMKTLGEDFGPDFVNMIVAIAKKIASEAGASAADSKVGEVHGAVKDIISHISGQDEKRHFSEIAAKHPDFRDIASSQGFKDFVESHATPDEAKRIAQGGSSDEINKLLDEYKASQAEESAESPAAEAAEKPAADPVVDHQMDAAEGVRSSGMALPDSPKKASDGYEAAWSEFA